MYYESFLIGPKQINRVTFYASPGLTHRGMYYCLLPPANVSYVILIKYNVFRTWRIMLNMFWKIDFWVGNSWVCGCDRHGGTGWQRWGLEHKQRLRIVWQLGKRNELGRLYENRWGITVTSTPAVCTYRPFFSCTALRGSFEKRMLLNKYMLMNFTKYFISLVTLRLHQQVREIM